MIYTILIGFLIGFTAKFMLPNNQPEGFIFTVVLGVAGALLAGWVVGATGPYEIGGILGFFAAVLGAVSILYVYGRLFPKPNE